MNDAQIIYPRLARLEAALKALYDLHRCVPPPDGEPCEVCAMMEKLK